MTTYSTLTQQSETPSGVFTNSVSSNVVEVPERLRGLGIERALKTVTCTYSNILHFQSGSDQEFRDNVKRGLALQLSKELITTMTFTHLAEPYHNDITVFGRVVILTPSQFQKLIDAAR